MMTKLTKFKLLIKLLKLYIYIFFYYYINRNPMIGCPEICGGKPENMYVNVSKICENMCL